MSTTFESAWENTRLKERIEELEKERDQLRRKVWMLQSAVKNLRDVKGRHHREIAYKRLIETLIATEPKE